MRFHELADNISQFAWTADANGWIYWYDKRWQDYTGAPLYGAVVVCRAAQSATSSSTGERQESDIIAPNPD